MCGLAGVMTSSVSYQEANIFKDLLAIASLRGSQGSGAAVVQNAYLRGPSIQVIKSKYISGALAYSDEFNELLHSRVSAIIGHARLPTKGGLDEDAVHPHRFGHIVGVHNGTMHRVAGQEVKDQSDSAMLFKAIAEVGIEEAIKESSGAYALVWADEKEQTLNFLKNTWRPLFFKNVGWGERNINTLYWSSEKEMLDFIFARSYKGNNTWDTYLPNDTLFKYPLEPKHIIRPVEVKADVRPTPPKPTVSRTNGGGHRGFARQSVVFPREGSNESGYRIVWNVKKQEYERVPFGKPSTGAEAGTTNGGGENPELPWAGVNRVLRLPPPDVAKMSKQAQKRYNKQLKEEERQAVVRLHTFRREKQIEDRRKTRAQQEGNLKPALAELVDDTPDIAAGPTHDPNRYRRIAHRHEQRDLRLTGQEVCDWCGNSPDAGDNVFMTDNDVGCKTFICYDCGTSNAAAAAYTADARVATVIY